jgi:ABC-type lipoprotein export system ATPase subunit/flagellar biosynthesis chaperone FliJ
MSKKLESSIGSEWRKWDLHLHAPLAKSNDQYKVADGLDVWKEFCDKLENSDVHVFGITDYFSADAYFNTLEKYKEHHANSKKLLIPNIEVRTSYVVNSAQEEVNLHILFNPSTPKVDQLIKKFLGCLNTNKTGSGGVRIKASDLSTKQDYEEATTTREFIDEALKETFGDKVDMTEFALILTAANNDGIRAERGKKRKLTITDELDKFSQGFYGNSNNTEHFLSKDRLEGEEEIEAKPVFSGCDAHSFEDLDAWLGKLVLNEGEILKQPTWIKADIDFEGLKYALYEPRERVFIGEEPGALERVRSNQTKYIKALHINKVEHYDGKHGVWFESETIHFNPELVAIIGNKGNGKSAVTDIIGLLGNSHNQKYTSQQGKSEELFSFLNKNKFLKGNCASNFTADLHWYAGDPDHKTLDEETDENLPEKVEYLPQKYLEKICANIEDDEFRGKLNEVIFGYVKDKDRYDQLTLDGLIEYLSSQTEADIQVIKESLHTANEKVVGIEAKLSPEYKQNIEEKKRIKQEEIDTHNKIKPAEVPKPSNATSDADASETSSLETQINTLASSVQDLKSEQATVSKKVQDFTQIKQGISREVDILKGLKQKYESQLTAEGITFDEVVSVSFDPSRIDALVATNETRLSEIGELLASEADIDSLGLNEAEKAAALEKSLVCKKSKLEKQKQAIVDRLDKPNQEYQAYLKAQQKWQTQYDAFVGATKNPAADTLNWLSQELEAIGTTYADELTIARQERKDIAKELFRKKITLISFYESVKKSIDDEIKKYSNELGDYDITIEASLRLDRSFQEEFFRCVSQSFKGSFYGVEEGKGALKTITDNIIDWQDEGMVEVFLDSVIDHIDFDKRKDTTEEGAPRGVHKQMKQGKDPVEFYDYLFGFDYLQTKYDLKVDEKDLSELSPGERGGLLLIFYLMLDRRDIPLVIDQPEDNLDNKSVYEILVTFLKKSKKRRQIIMVTHNPNLAVVADAEQIVHVSIDKKNKNSFDFYSGAIENPEINGRVVDILEGTLPAFDNRKLKYKKK